MKRELGAPAKIITAGVNLGFIAAALALPTLPSLTWLAMAVWGIHGAMALATAVIAPSRGMPRSRALEVLMVGTLSFVQVQRAPRV